MKKRFIALMATTILLGAGSVTSFAASGSKTTSTAPKQFVNFVDENKDGICDNAGKKFVDKDGDGICDNAGKKFVDKDGDGVCDNAGKNAKNKLGKGKNCGKWRNIQ